MADETEGQDTGAEAETGGVAGADPAAMATALGGASRARADRFLEEQTALAANQNHYVRERYKQLVEQVVETGLRVWVLRLNVLLRVATVVMGVAFAAVLAFMVWDAAHSDGLVIDAFSVPPDLAARGMTGQVVAAQFLDQLVKMQKETDSARAAKSYVNNWSGQDIKLAIPETGVSLNELDTFLRGKLGHETHITGEVVRTASGFTLTARAGALGAVDVAGAETELDGLAAKSAEAIYRLTQPYRYARLRRDKGGVDEAIAVNKELMKTGSRLDRMWAHATWGYITGYNYDLDGGLVILRQAVADEPNNVLGWRMIGQLSNFKSHPEEALNAFQNGLSHLSDNTQENYAPALVPLEQKLLQSQINDQLGAYHDAAQVWADFVRNPLPGDSAGAYSRNLAYSKAGEHDLAAARAADSGAGIDSTLMRTRMANDSQDWTAVLSLADAGTRIKKTPTDNALHASFFAPLAAYAHARLGRIAAAEKTIAPTRADCYDCLIARAGIADMQGQHARADWWFARAVDGNKSIPFAYSAWGQALLARGDPNGAIAKFTLANKKGPHFADPLEGWGEALMAQSRSDLALAKFTQADKYAPNWGRLHLKWGEALFYAGRKDEARAQYRKASTLDLSAADKAELARSAPY